MAAALFGVALWFCARSLSELRWMIPSPRIDTASANPIEARPFVRFMPAWVVWWLPRILGMAPPLLMAVALLWGVGGIGVSPWMALLLILEAAAASISTACFSAAPGCWRWDGSVTLNGRREPIG